jgi:hypothetical protein
VDTRDFCEVDELGGVADVKSVWQRGVFETLLLVFLASLYAGAFFQFTTGLIGDSV